MAVCKDLVGFAWRKWNCSAGAEFPVEMVGSARGEGRAEISRLVGCLLERSTAPASSFSGSTFSHEQVSVTSIRSSRCFDRDEI